MRRTSWMVLGMIGVLLAAIVYINAAGQPAQSDESRILSLLDSGRQAVERKDLRAALSLISPGYNDGGMDRDAIRAYAIQAFQADEKYDLSLSDTAVEVRGDTADVQTHLLVTTQGADGGQRRLYDGTMVFRLDRQRSRRWLVVPASTWRIAGISGLPTGFDE